MIKILSVSGWMMIVLSVVLMACTPAAAAQNNAVYEDCGDCSNAEDFIVSSPAVDETGLLPAEYTCDGASATLPLVWSHAPAETKSFAVIMHHVASPNDLHWYWVLYNIPAEVTSLAKNSSEVGILGTNSVNGKTAYAPPCSKGPGEKIYTITVYALADQPRFSVPANQIDRDALLEAIENSILASAELNVSYTRK